MPSSVIVTILLMNALTEIMWLLVQLSVCDLVPHSWALQFSTILLVHKLSSFSDFLSKYTPE